MPNTRLPSPSHVPSFGASFREHWLVRLGVRALVLGISPILIYLAYERVTGFEGQNHEGFGILALVGLNLGVLLLAAGFLAVALGRTRRGAGRVGRESR